MRFRIAAFLASCLIVFALPLRGADTAPSEVEAAVAEQVAADQVTIVHFWASWCPNCKSEHTDDGWRSFVEANPEVKVIFVSVWGSDAKDREMLEAYGLTALPNFQAFRHPNQSRKSDERMTHFLGTPVTWLPSTWVYRKGRLRYALNYGEVRFDLLAQLVADSTASWSHRK